jgi:hypothetical protein
MDSRSFTSLEASGVLWLNVVDYAKYITGSVVVCFDPIEDFTLNYFLLDVECVFETKYIDLIVENFMRDP